MRCIQKPCILEETNRRKNGLTNPLTQGGGRQGAIIRPTPPSALIAIHIKYDMIYTNHTKRAPTTVINKGQYHFVCLWALANGITLLLYTQCLLGDQRFLPRKIQPLLLLFLFFSFGFVCSLFVLKYQKQPRCHFRDLATYPAAPYQNKWGTLWYQ